MRLFNRFATASLFAAVMAFASPATLPAQTAQQPTPQDQAQAQADQAKAKQKKAKHKAKKAGHQAKNAAKDTGSAAKSAAGATKDGAQAAAKGTTGTVKKLGRKTGDAAAGTHNNATAKCVDGSFSYANNRADACKDHGGVATWMGK